MVWKHPANPADTKEDTGRVRRGLGKRTAVFFAGSDGILPHQRPFGHDDGNCAIVREFFGWLWRIFYCGDVAKHDFSFVVVNISDAPCHHIAKAVGSQY